MIMAAVFCVTGMYEEDETGVGQIQPAIRLLGVGENSRLWWGKSGTHTLVRDRSSVAALGNNEVTIRPKAALQGQHSFGHPAEKGV